MTVYFYQFLELFATFIEGAIALFVSTNLAGKKYSSKKNTAYILFSSILYTVLITLMNNWQSFSFATVAVAILFTFIVMCLATNGKIMYKLCSIMITWFFLNITEYIISYSLIMMLGKSFNISEGISLILNPGPIRSFYILLNKFLQIIVFFAFKRLYPKLRCLDKKGVTLIWITITAAYIVMSILTNLIVSSSVVLLQIAIILSLFFIGITMVAIIISIAASFKYQNEKREKELLTVTNNMMEKNYTEIKYIQDTIRKQVHDFKNHLQTISGMLPNETRAKEYLNDLLKTSYQQAQNCNCGNDIIDSIINCKMNEALIQNIEFKHKIQLTSKLNISSVDICAILANQIDNAIEACIKISDNKSKFIKVEIWQKEYFVFFKVTNTVSENPFSFSKELETTKPNKEFHGLGIKNIQDTANKYNGYLKNDYIDNCFVSLVMISNND